MATREFDAEYIFIVAEAALIGLDNRIHNEWIRECRPNYELSTQKKNRFQRIFEALWYGKFFTPFEGTFEEFVEYRKTWKHEWAQRTLWEYHRDSWSNVRKNLKTIRNLAEKNINASNVIRLNDDEYHMLCFYKKVERNEI